MINGKTVVTVIVYKLTTVKWGAYEMISDNKPYNINKLSQVTEILLNMKSNSKFTSGINIIS